MRHRRDRPSDEFSYPLYMAYLDLDELPELFDGRWLWSARRPALAWFRRADYLGDPNVPLAEAVRELVRERVGLYADGPIRLLTHMRCFGHCFNPVSFYYCYAATGPRAGAVTAVVAEVTNTPWGERHSYVMAVSEASDHGSAALMSASFAKQLHVSPLMGMEHNYNWRLTEPSAKLAVQIDSHDRAGARAFDATLALRRREISRRSLARALARYPLLTPRIMARIYGHALRLRLRGASYFPHPNRAAPSR